MAMRRMELWATLPNTVFLSSLKKAAQAREAPSGERRSVGEKRERERKERKKGEKRNERKTKEERRGNERKEKKGEERREEEGKGKARKERRTDDSGMEAADWNAMCNTAPRLAGNVSTSSSRLSAPPLQHNIPARAAVIMKQDAVWSLHYYDRPARCRLRRAEVMCGVHEPVDCGGGGAGHMCDQNTGGGF